MRFSTGFGQPLGRKEAFTNQFCPKDQAKQKEERRLTVDLQKPKLGPRVVLVIVRLWVADGGWLGC